jgi:phosphohistidine phosphatase
MHTLYLLRHAKSSWSDPSLPDHESPLAPKGVRDAKRLAKHLRRLEITPALVLCSSAPDTRDVRARAAQRLRAVPDTVGSLLLIGHNPGLHDLALVLTATGAELDRLEAKFPTAGLATLALPRSTWSTLGQGDAELVSYVVPKQLR